MNKIHDFGLPYLGACALWLGTILLGTGVLLRYETRPGAACEIAAEWPQQSSLELGDGATKVVMFIHPHCPCTRASVSEFERLYTVCRERAHFSVVALDDSRESWRHSDIIDTLRRIPQVQLVWDTGGIESGLFGVRTSGHVLAYSRDGSAIFSGGITGSRGHEGDNAGRTALIRILRDGFPGGTPEFVETSVFGCSLINPATGAARDLVE